MCAVPDCQDGRQPQEPDAQPLRPHSTDDRLPNVVFKLSGNYFEDLSEKNVSLSLEIRNTI